jgi:sulfate adenylyltransferase
LSEPFYDVIEPHGGSLVDRVLRGDARLAALERAATLTTVPLGPTGLCDLELIVTGALSPLSGFMTSADYSGCVENMRLANGLVWPIPVTLAIDEDLAGTVAEGDAVALCEGDRILALMDVVEKYRNNRAVKEREALEVYQTTDPAHPGVARLYRRGEVHVGGDISLVEWPRATRTEFPELRHTPVQTRRMFAGRGWRSVVGFQTRNPIHRAHEYIQKTALEIVDGLFLHPLVGETKQDDIPADVRIASYQAILRDYYPAERVVLGVFPAAMRYAGPREAVFHAIARQNYGCTHFIVGRDHAGVGTYYGTYDAQNIFDQFPRDDIGIVPLKFEHAFYCRTCDGVVSAKTCPHGPEHRVFLSGTQVREMLERGEMLPEEFTRPEVARVLLEGVQRLREGRSEGDGVASE